MFIEDGVRWWLVVCDLGNIGGWVRTFFGVVFAPSLTLEAFYPSLPCCDNVWWSGRGVPCDLGELVCVVVVCGVLCVIVGRIASVVSRP